MTRLNTLHWLCLAACAVAFSSCSSVSPSDEPLPTFAQLRDEFDVQPAGRGVLREGSGTRGDRYDLSARYLVDRTGGISQLFIYLQNDTSVSLTINRELDGPDPRLGQFGNAFFSYFNDGGDGARGSGRLEITSVEDGRLEGVFAADLTPGGLYPDFRRIRGAFNAVLDTTAQ